VVKPESERRKGNWNLKGGRGTGIRKEEGELESERRKGNRNPKGGRGTIEPV
jgi:hypothetical protein